MAKAQTVFVCQQCGHEAVRWLGRCPGCGAWNSLVEEARGRSAGVERPWPTGQGLVSMQEISAEAGERARTGIGELDRVLGGGIVRGSLVLIGGDPGIGKSTLMLQVAAAISGNYGPVVYVSGEESPGQVKMRADRLGRPAARLYVLCETDMEDVEEKLLSAPPCLAIIDSIQTMHRPELESAPGSVGQVRECAAHLMRLAKSTGVPIFLVGHVTKEGSLAGPRVLEHMVDTVLYFEGDRYQSYRILRAVKNRFGSTNEIGVFEMREEGLVEIPSPSELFLAERPGDAAGSVVVASMEGTRPLLVEVQALVCPTSFPVPRRMATGVDYNKVSLVMAVLDKKVGMPLQSHDAYVKVTGGLRIDEPALDLGLATAIASSFQNRSTGPGVVVVGEVGLGGEVRRVGHIERRMAEAARLGFVKCVAPAGNLRGVKLKGDLEVAGVSTVREALRAALAGGEN